MPFDTYSIRLDLPGCTSEELVEVVETVTDMSVGSAIIEISCAEFTP
ncbi:hypothetical protein JW859_07765 [bacterium]|nr:hypothetical protein [bacterium]